MPIFFAIITYFVNRFFYTVALFFEVLYSST